MDKDDFEQFEKILMNVLNKRARIPEERHLTHHDFVENLIVERQRRDERIESIRRQVIGWSIITAIGALGYSAWAYLLNTIRNGTGH